MYNPQTRMPNDMFMNGLRRNEDAQWYAAGGINNLIS